jgi:hypothetical protein
MKLSPYRMWCIKARIRALAAAWSRAGSVAPECEEHMKNDSDSVNSAHFPDAGVPNQVIKPPRTPGRQFFPSNSAFLGVLGDVAVRSTSAERKITQS